MGLCTTSCKGILYNRSRLRFFENLQSHFDVSKFDFHSFAMCTSLRNSLQYFRIQMYIGPTKMKIIIQKPIIIAGPKLMVVDSRLIISITAVVNIDLS